MTMIDLSGLKSIAPKTSWRWTPPPASLQNLDGLLSFGKYYGPSGLVAIVAVEQYGQFEAGAGTWLHISISREKRMPTWEDLVNTRDALGYQEWLFVQIVAPRSAWLNVHPYCLHLWHRLGEDTVPRAVWDQHGADGSRYGQHR